MTTLQDLPLHRVTVNCSRGEAGRLALPGWAREIDLATLDDVLGWRDAKAPGRAVLLVPTDDGPAGVVLSAASEHGVRSSAMCALCRTTHGAGGVALFAATRRGAAGRRGDTVGTYVCADLACARHVRVDRPTAALRPDPGLTVDERRRGLRERAREFLDALGDRS
ncbi:FBP domain-containing protein [Actinomycetospora chiangmaiensis]|uniref:FBP domain-containing protein n=1 Tax=Actinomycetospora chiangmaiensis TaxID=402650 RepID=UPI00036FF3B5|nr:FBP domain-containing protein [Actinomycetospora chiangmaiensis]